MGTPCPKFLPVESLSICCKIVFQKYKMWGWKFFSFREFTGKIEILRLFKLFFISSVRN